MDNANQELGAGLWGTEYYVRRPVARITNMPYFLRENFLPALDMQLGLLLYINEGLKAPIGAFSPAIIIEDQYLQTFLHTLQENVFFIPL